MFLNGSFLVSSMFCISYTGWAANLPRRETITSWSVSVRVNRPHLRHIRQVKAVLKSLNVYFGAKSEVTVHLNPVWFLGWWDSMRGDGCCDVHASMQKYVNAAHIRIFVWLSFSHGAHQSHMTWFCTCCLIKFTRQTHSPLLVIYKSVFITPAL